MSRLGLRVQNRAILGTGGVGRAQANLCAQFSIDPSQPFSWQAVGSFVPAWTSPFYGVGCSNVYEVADPAGGELIGVPNPTSGQVDLFVDAVFHSWFARTASTSLVGRYYIAGVFQHASDPC